MGFDSPSRFPIDRLLSGRTGDVVATSDDVWPELLEDAYDHGIFPWPSGEGEIVPWCSPRKRALLFFDELKLPRSLAKARRNDTLTYTLDRDFEAVIRACADQPRPGQSGTWITDSMIRAYVELHRRGRAHSVEAWRAKGPEAWRSTSVGGSASGGAELVGGIYGVDSGGAFSAESMFYREPNASKLALLRLVDLLKEKGSEWLDIQQLTPHLVRLGAREISRRDYLLRLSRAQSSASGRLF